MISGLPLLLETEEKIAYLEKVVERQSLCITRYMNKNQDLWLAIAKFPGGLEIARKLGRPEL